MKRRLWIGLYVLAVALVMLIPACRVVCNGKAGATREAGLLAVHGCDAAGARE